MTSATESQAWLMAASDQLGFHLTAVATLLAYAVYTGLGHRFFRKRPWFCLSVQLVLGLIAGVMLWAIGHFKLEESDAMITVLTAVIVFDGWLILLTVLFLALPSLYKRNRFGGHGQHYKN